MMTNQGTKLLVLLATLTQGILSAPNVCRDASAPPSKPRGVNQVDRLSGTPLFDLHVTPINNPMRRGQVTAYKISISIEEGKPFRFSEATLAVSANGSCGSGDFEFKTQDFVEVMQEHGANCPRLIQTKRKTHMTELSPLTWVPPSCGCVQFRILVVESGEVYYAENEGVETGPLAKTVCLQRRLPHQRVKISREQRLASLCHVIDKHASSEIMSRRQFLERRQLEAKLMDRLGIEMALELRRHDTKTCCHKEEHEMKMRCFDDARRRRIDQFCANGMTEIPFRTFRRNHMRNLEKSCCFILGEFRYKCFSKNSKLTLDSEDEANIFDYSMDASDVVNDLADFGSREHLDELLRPIESYNENDDDDDEDEDDEDDDDDDESDEEYDEDDQVMDDDSEEDEVSEAILQPIEGTVVSKKKAFVQRSPPRYVKKKMTNPLEDHKKPPPVSSVPLLTSKRNRLSSEERRRKLRKQARRKSSQEQRRLLKAERANRSRESRERRRGQRVGDNKRGKIIRNSHYQSGADFRRKSSKERRWGYSSRLADPYRKGSGRSREVKGRGHTERKPLMTVDQDVNGQTEDDFEDQGGVSVDKTLKKLQRRIRRLKLRNMCCKAGAEVGGQVYGRVGQVTEECRHSSLKFVGGLGLLSNSRKCASQFIDCCLEEAKKGVPMTSQEFLDNTMNYYWDNNQRFDPRLMGSVLAQRKRQQPQYRWRDPYAKPFPRPQKKKDRRYDLQDKDFQTVQSPQPFITPTVSDKQPAAEATRAAAVATPIQRNSVPDNVKNASRGAQRANLILSSKDLDRTTRAPVTETTGAKKSILNSTMAPLTQEKSNPGVPTLTRVILVELENPQASVDKRKEGKLSRNPDDNRRFKSSRKEISREDFDDRYRPPTIFDNVMDDGIDSYSDDTDDDDEKGSDNPKDLEEEESSEYEVDQKKTINTEGILARKESDERRSFLKKSNSQRATIEEDKFIEVARHQKLKNKADSSGQTFSSHGLPAQKAPEAVSSRTIPHVRGADEREEGIKAQLKQRRRNRHKNQKERNKRKRHHFKSTNGIGALDSREMAERNARQFAAAALDSREMADQYKARNPDRFRLRNYDYFKPSRKRLRAARILNW